VLPQTPDSRKEPGIWAAGPGGAPEPLLLRILLPLPPDAETETDKGAVLQCAQMMTGILALARAHEAALALPPPVRTCLAARLYLACAEGMVADLDDAAREAWHYSREHMVAAKKMRKMAEGFHKAACRDTSVRKPSDDIAEAAIREFQTLRGRKP
jgi:hypothetical protein